MRMLILLAVFWATGSLLLAAESPPAQTPAAPAKEEKKAEQKADEPQRKPTIAEQAEAALKAAAEADAGSAKDPAKRAGEDDDAQTPPAGNAGKGPSPQRFVPSEQVRADFDVSFPIDI